MSPQRPESNRKDTAGSNRALMASTTTKDLWKNKLKRKILNPALKLTCRYIVMQITYILLSIK